MTLTSIDQQLAYLTKGCVEVVRPAELRSKLERAAGTGRPLVVKVGFDPTAPDLHLGHTVLLRKMKHFQDLGHRVIFLIGDFTGLIGDPTGRSKTRPPLGPEEIATNAETYKSQVFRILDPERTVVDFNSRWLSALGAEGMIRLAARYNVAQMLERRDFRQRYEHGRPIGVHEFLYPLAQAYDSVFLQADVELGGTDQFFNLNVGRDIMPRYGLDAQVVMTTPLLEGLDGVEKMSKSLGNYVGIAENAEAMFGKLMSIGDELMWRYYLLLTDLSASDIERLQTAAAGTSEGARIAIRDSRVSAGLTMPSGTANPGLQAVVNQVPDEEARQAFARSAMKQFKLHLAELIVRDFHGPAAALQAHERFEARGRGEATGDELVLDWSLPTETRPFRQLLIDLKLVTSGREADQKLDQGAVSIDGQRVGGKLDPQDRYLERDREHRLDIGRRTYRLRVR